MAKHAQQCPCTTPFGEPCSNSCSTLHPYMPEAAACCFECKESLIVTREAARLSTEGVPLVSNGRVKSKFQLPAGFQYQAGSVGGPARETLCALCTKPVDGDEPMLECCGSRDGTACKLVWHNPCHEAISSTVAPPQDGVLQCCTGWPARSEIDPKDRFREPYTFYRNGIAKPGSLRSTAATAGAQAQPQPSPRVRMGWPLFFALVSILSGLVTIASAPTISATVVERLRSAASSFDMPAPWASTNHSASTNAPALQETAFQEPASQEPAANYATPNLLYMVKDFLFDLPDAPPDDALEEGEMKVEEMEEVEEVEDPEPFCCGGGGEGVGDGGDQGSSEGVGGGRGDGDSGDGGRGEGGTVSALLHSVAASTYGAMVVNAFAPNVFPVVRATLFNAGQYFAFLRGRRDAATVAAAAAATALATEEPEWLVVAGQRVDWSPQE